MSQFLLTSKKLRNNDVINFFKYRTTYHLIHIINGCLFLYRIKHLLLRFPVIRKWYLTHNHSLTLLIHYTFRESAKKVDDCKRVVNECKQMKMNGKLVEQRKLCAL